MMVRGMAYVTSLSTDSLLIYLFSIFVGSSSSSCSLNIIIIKIVTLMEEYSFYNLHASYHLIIKPLICWTNIGYLPHI